jgi:hypothetical protein
MPHLLDNRFTDDGEVICLTPAVLYTPKRISGTLFYWRLSRPQGHSALEELCRYIEKNAISLGIEPATILLDLTLSQRLL